MGATNLMWTALLVAQTNGRRRGHAKEDARHLFLSGRRELAGGYVERGNTAIMVDYIKELADVDVFEIVPVVHILLSMMNVQHTSRRKSMRTADLHTRMTSPTSDYEPSS